MAKKITIRMGGYGPPSTTHSRGLKYIGDELTKKFGNSLEMVSIHCFGVFVLKCCDYRERQLIRGNEL